MSANLERSALSTLGNSRNVEIEERAFKCNVRISQGFQMALLLPSHKQNDFFGHFLGEIWWLCEQLYRL